MSKKQKKRSVEELYWVDVHLKALAHIVRKEERDNRSDNQILEEFAALAASEREQALDICFLALT